MTLTMPDVPILNHERIEMELEGSFQNLLLEHARMGRCVYEGHDGKVVEITPEEIFARYGLDANGRPPTQTSPMMGLINFKDVVKSDDHMEIDAAGFRDAAFKAI